MDGLLPIYRYCGTTNLWPLEGDFKTILWLSPSLAMARLGLLGWQSGMAWMAKSLGSVEVGEDGLA